MSCHGADKANPAPDKDILDNTRNHCSYHKAIVVCCVIGKCIKTDPPSWIEQGHSQQSACIEDHTFNDILELSTTNRKVNMCVRNVEVFKCGCENPNVYLTPCKFHRWRKTQHVITTVRHDLPQLCPSCTERFQNVYARAIEYADRVQEHLVTLLDKLKEIFDIILYLPGINTEETMQLNWAEEQLSFVNVDNATMRVQEVEQALNGRIAAFQAIKTRVPGSDERKADIKRGREAETSLDNLAQNLNADKDPGTFAALAQVVEDVAKVSIQHDYVQRQLRHPAPILKRLCATCGQLGRCICQSRAEWQEHVDDVTPQQPLDDNEHADILEAITAEWNNDPEAQAIHHLAQLAAAGEVPDVDMVDFDETASLHSNEDALRHESIDLYDETASLQSNDDALRRESIDLYDGIN